MRGISMVNPGFLSAGLLCMYFWQNTLVFHSAGPSIYNSFIYDGLHIKMVEKGALLNGKRGFQFLLADQWRNSSLSGHK